MITSRREKSEWDWKDFNWEPTDDDWPSGD